MKFCRMRVCWHLFCVCTGCWLVGFFVSFWGQQKHSYPFPLPPSSATCWYPVQDMFPVCLHALFENQWFSALCLIFPTLPAQGLSCFPQQSLLPAPSLGKYKTCCSQLGLLYMWSSSSSSPIASSLYHVFPTRRHLKSSYWDFLLLPTPSCVLEYLRQALQQEGSGCNWWSKLMISFPHSLFMSCEGFLVGLGDGVLFLMWDEWGQGSF